MAQIQNAEVTKALIQEFGVVGGLPSLRLSEEVLPTVLVGDVSGARPPPPARRVVANGFQAAIIGEFADASLSANPGTLIEVTLVIISPFVGGDVSAIFNATGTAGGATAGGGMSAEFTDWRTLLDAGVAPTQPSALAVFGTAIAALPTRNFGYFIDLNGTPMVLQFQEGKSPWVLWNPPAEEGGAGQRGMIWTLDTANTGCSFTFGWTEYSYARTPHP